MRKNNKGFTLVELLAVIVIMGILMMVAIPAVTRTIENSRKDTFVDIAKAYVNAVRTSWTTDSMQCGSSNSYASAMDDGDYYILIDTADPNRLSVLDKGGKSSWGNRDVKGYVRVNVSTVNDKKITKFYISLADGTHGVYDNLASSKEADKLVRGDILMNLSEASQAEILAKIQTEPFVNGKYTTCSEEGGNWTGSETGGGSGTPPASFATDSWETIINAVRNNNTDAYNVGDEKEVTLTGTGDLGQTLTVRIVNKSTPAECATPGFSQTACGFVLEFKDIITDYGMSYFDSSYGGWPASKLYPYVQNDVYNALPTELKSGIIDTSVVSGHGIENSSNFISTDKLYLFSTKEVYGKEGTSNIINYDTAEAETRQLDYYKNNGVTTSSYSGAQKTYQGSADSWWLRTAYSYDHNHFYTVLISGFGSAYSSLYASSGVAPAFRIG